MNVLEVKNVSVSFTQYSGGFKQAELTVIKDLSVTVRRGEMVAVVGSSGSGKSLLAHGILGILPYNAALRGEMLYMGEPLTQRRKEALRGREIMLVPQSVAYLDPLMKVGEQLRNGKKDEGSRQKSSDLLARYGLEPKVNGLYPFELSGGMARRILIATAVMEQPRLVVADEPTPGLDMATAKRVLGHFREIADDGAAVLLITHDLELAAAMADRVVVFYAGQTVEEAAAADFIGGQGLRHPYTKALWSAMPRNGFEAISGAQPQPWSSAAGCAFAPRCPLAADICRGEIPYIPASGGFVRCVRYESEDGHDS